MKNLDKVIKFRPGEEIVAALLVNPEGGCRFTATGAIPKRMLLDMLASATEQTRLEVLAELLEARAAAREQPLVERAVPRIFQPGEED